MRKLYEGMSVPTIHYGSETLKYNKSTVRTVGINYLRRVCGLRKIYQVKDAII